MALGSSTFMDLSGAVSDLFASEGHRSKAEGDLLEAKNYDMASALALQNKAFTETSTEIKQSQLDRQIYQTIGGQRANVAAGGFAASGSALDLMRDSAQQGALTKAVAGQQGLITEAGYQEQSDAARNMSQAAHVAADAENNAAMGANITAGIKGAAAIATLF